jgi:8-oxo-dGTP diphosphatase
VAAIIYSAQQDQVLIAKRPINSHQGGLWEFPGGKVQSGEAPYEALCRELREELDISIISAKYFLTEDYDYPDKQIRLESWMVTAFDGEVKGNEGQKISWVLLNALTDFDFPPANFIILSRLAELQGFKGLRV